MRKNMEAAPVTETSREIWICERPMAAFSGRIWIFLDARDAMPSNICVFLESTRSLHGFATMGGIDSINRDGLAYLGRRCGGGACVA